MPNRGNRLILGRFLHAPGNNHPNTAPAINRNTAPSTKLLIIVLRGTLKQKIGTVSTF